MMTTSSPSFFDYSCDVCGAPVCERMLLFTLAHGFEEETLCLACLGEALSLPLDRLIPKTQGYIQSRDCFRKPWDAVTNTATCPHREAESAFVCCSA
jgi:hypothetical protein